MSTRGRKPKPLKFRLISGTAKPASTRPELAFTPVQEFPPPPQHLNPDGAELWNRLGSELLGCGVLQSVDLYALGQLAYAWQKHLQKAKAGMDITAAEDAGLRHLLSEFGATPAARQRVAAGAVGDRTNPFTKFKTNG